MSTLQRWAIAAMLMIGLFAGVKLALHHSYHKGELAEAGRRDKAEKIESDRADAERNVLNARIAGAQASLNAARATVAALEKEFDHEKTVSDQRRIALLAGDQRMRVLVRARSPNQAGPTCGAAAGPMDSEPDVIADLAGTTAAAIDGLRVDHNAAVDRLNACITSFDALKHAVDTMP